MRLSKQILFLIMFQLETTRNSFSRRIQQLKRTLFTNYFIE